MPPKESEALLSGEGIGNKSHTSVLPFNSYGSEECNGNDDDLTGKSSSQQFIAWLSALWNCRRCFCCCIVATIIVVAIELFGPSTSEPSRSSSSSKNKFRSEIHNVATTIAEETKTTTSSSIVKKTGPYKLVEAHKGKSFFDYYEFNDGPDSIGSAGYNN